MAPQAEIPPFDPRAVDNVMKLGGKKKLDALIEILNGSAPHRLEDLKKAASPAQARTAAQSLKVTAGNLGLARLEDLCDQVLEANRAPDAALARQLEQALGLGRKALAEHRARL